MKTLLRNRRAAQRRGPRPRRSRATGRDKGPDSHSCVQCPGLPPPGGGPPGAHFSRCSNRNACDASGLIGVSRGAHSSSCRSMSASYSTWQPSGLLKYQNQLEPILVPSGAPKRLIAGFDEARAREHQLGRPAHVEREMFAALHERRRLDEEQRVVILRAGRAQKRPGVQQPVRDLETEALDIERFRRSDVGHETDDMRERARLGGHLFPDADLIRAALRRRAGGVDPLARQVKLAPDRELKFQRKAQVVLRLDCAVGQALNLPVVREFARDFRPGSPRRRRRKRPGAACCPYSMAAGRLASLR